MFSFHSFFGGTQSTEQLQHLTVSSTTNPTSLSSTTSNTQITATNSSNSTAASNKTTSIDVASSSNNSSSTLTISSASTNTVVVNPSSISNKNLLKDSTITISGGKPQNLSQRIKFLQSQLAHAPMPSITSKRRQLPTIEEAWNLPISAEMSSRQQQSAQANQQRAFTKGGYTQVTFFFFGLVGLI